MTLPILTLVVKRVSDVREEQKKKARLVIEVTLAGIVTVVSELHHIKARNPDNSIVIIIVDINDNDDDNNDDSNL